MKKIFYSLIFLTIAITLIFASPVYGAESGIVPQDTQYTKENYNYLEKAKYLNEMKVLTTPGTVFDLDDTLTKVEMAAIITKTMIATDPNWTITDKHSFKDVPSWANFYVGVVDANGIIKGVSDTKFDPYVGITLNDFTTSLLRAMGYGYNSDVKEFSWDTSVKTALEVGLINDDEYKTLTSHKAFTRADMILMTYNAVKSYNNNPYTDSYLMDLVERYKPSNELIKFSNTDDPTRTDYLKEQFRYFAIYYKDSAEARACLDLLRPHANKVYAMLENLYGIQPAVDIYLVDGAIIEAKESKSAPVDQHPVVKNDHMTYVVLDNDDANGNNLGEFIQVLNTTFYENMCNTSGNRMTYTKESLPWMVQTTRDLIGSMYTKYNYSGKVDQANMFNLTSMRRNLRDFITDNNTKSLTIKSLDDEETTLYEYYYYSKMFSFKDPGDFEGCLSNVGIVNTKGLLKSAESQTNIPVPTGKTLLDVDKTLAN